MAPPQFGNGQSSEAVLRINIPLDSYAEQRQEYRILFRDEAMVRQAILSAESATVPDKEEDKARVIRDEHGRERGKSGWQLAPNKRSTEDITEEDLIKRHRQEALDILEGLRAPRRYYDWKGAQHEEYFNRRAAFELVQSATELVRRRPRATHGPGAKDGKSRPFRWEQFHHTIVDQLSERDRAVFPAWREDMAATLLFMRPEDESGVERVESSFALHEHSLSEFRTTMLDVSARGWRDVLWLSYPWQQLPLGFRKIEALEMQWGEQMI
ncbi:hypothetical protein ACRE_024150 [Hapsidospora chrysogenum ATCC 11550]|uniref:Uncharacterized protein n=1 Tax=Hapsidospora chrysogenum (strain ATCC 11550 / CBS 779.69 / DSM 880 / IAM 14645 / JCM 23072 / IMI 49137) TaxID=857340 RepID=A0A086TBK3_HAPC1|nr:hypothetical protein ACRE_024150 [Hapsidospora chrysogenum ATCC 11550]